MAFVTLQLDELMNALYTMKKEKQKKSTAEKRKKTEVHKKVVKRAELTRMAKHKETKKKLYKIMAGKNTRR